jgi:hypothetical protein
MVFFFVPSYESTPLHQILPRNLLNILHQIPHCKCLLLQCLNASGDAATVILIFIS